MRIGSGGSDIYRAVGNLRHDEVVGDDGRLSRLYREIIIDIIEFTVDFRLHRPDFSSYARRRYLVYRSRSGFRRLQEILVRIEIDDVFELRWSGIRDLEGDIYEISGLKHSSVRIGESLLHFDLACFSELRPQVGSYDCQGIGIHSIQIGHSS